MSTIADLCDHKKVLSLQVLIVKATDDGLVVADNTSIAFLSVNVEAKYTPNSVVSLLKPKLVEKTPQCIIIKPHPAYSPTILKTAVIKIPELKMSKMLENFSYKAPESRLLNTLSNEEEVDIEVYITGSAKVEKGKPYDLYFIRDKSGSVGRVMDYLKAPIPVGTAGMWKSLVTVERKEDYSVLLKTSRRSSFVPSKAIWDSFKSVQVGKCQTKNATLVGFTNVLEDRADLCFVDTQHDDLVLSFEKRKLGVSGDLSDHLESLLARKFIVDYDKTSKLNFGVRLLED